MADNRKLSALPQAAALAAADRMYLVQQGLSCQASLGQFVTFAAATMQPAAANLTALSGLEALAGRLPYFTGTGAMATTPTTTYGRSLLGLADAGAGRGALGAASQAALDALSTGTTSALNAKADKAATLTGAGLVTGGGDLSASRTLTVAEASEAEALAGAAADKAMTPRRTQAVVEAAVAMLQGELAATQVMAKSVRTPHPVIQVGDLPACVTGIYLCNEGGGDFLHDALGGSDVDMSVGVGYSWNRGILTLNNGWFKTASRTARAMFIVYRTNEGPHSGGYYLSSPSGKALGDSYGSPLAAIPDVRIFTGHNIRPLSRNDDAGGYTRELTGGGWTGVCATFPADETGTWVVGAGNTSGAGAAVKEEIAAIGFCSAQPTDEELKTIRDFIRGHCNKRRIFLTADDCPLKAKLLVITGESTAHGTMATASLSPSDKALYNDLTYILAADGQTVANRKMTILRFADGSANANAPGNTNAFGLEFGVLKSRLAQSDLTYRLDILKVGIGSTTELPSGSYTNAVGGTTTITVSQTRYSGESRVGSLFHTVEHSHFLHAEQIARNSGVGYETVIVVEAGWLNAAFIGSQAVTSAAQVQAISQAMYEFRKTYWGVPNLKQISLKPHEPYGGLGGGDTDYPNNAVGADRLVALGRARDGLDLFAVANAANVLLLDGNDYLLDYAHGDYVHPGLEGYAELGQDVEAVGAWEVVIEAN